MISEGETTPGMRQFRRMLENLLLAHARDVGPEFGGIDPESIPMRRPIPIGWVLMVDWEDAEPDADEPEASIVTVSSGLRLSQKIGLLYTGLKMAEDE